MKGLFLLAWIFLLAQGASIANIMPVDSDQFIRLQLAGDDINARDETVILFKKTAKADFKAGEDVRYLQGSGKVRLYSYSSNRVALVFNFQPLPAKSLQVYLNVFTRSDGTYQLKMPELVGIPQLYDIWLVDNFIKDSLDFRHNPSYSFNVSKADTNTFGGRRFKIVIKRNSALESRLVNFTADRIIGTKQVKLAWSAENEAYSTTYILERSVNKGKTFDALGSLTSSSKGFYSMIDNAPADGAKLYRLKQIDLTDSVSYSATAKVDDDVVQVSVPKALKSTTLNIYPNPVASVLNVAVGNKMSPATYSISVTNIWGMKVKEGTTTGTDWQSEVSDLKPGMYMVTVTSNTDKSVVGFNKFLKK